MLSVTCGALPFPAASLFELHKKQIRVSIWLSEQKDLRMEGRIAVRAGCPLQSSTEASSTASSPRHSSAAGL